MYTFIDWILFILLALCVGYLLFYAIASKFYRPRKLSEARIQRRFLVLFPAYKEDRVIVSTIRSFLKQEYPKEMYDVLVISDQMQPDTNAALQALLFASSRLYQQFQSQSPYAGNERHCQRIL